MAVDRRDVRIVLSLPARYSLANRRDMEGRRREFPGRLLNISARALSLMGPATGDKGERVIVHIDEFGKLEGPIISVLDGAFVMEIFAPPHQREKLASKISWYEKNKNHDIENHRAHERIMPRNPNSTLVFADGTTMDCLVVNVSASGAAIAAGGIPEIGTVVALGKVVGRVVRQFPEGFGLRFIELQDMQAIESLIARH